VAIFPEARIFGAIESYLRGSRRWWVMFDFIKKLKTVYEIPEPLSVRERALKVFSTIAGLEDIKEMMLRALESSHILLIGPPASSKSLFMLEIEKFMQSKVYFAEGVATSKAGLQRFIAENPHKEIIIIDEIDKMSTKDQEGLLGMMERGEFVSTKVRNTKTVKADVVIFATKWQLGYKRGDRLIDALLANPKITH
jgi:DNA replicative helicase MCM subunit Mcm2 (Cdc46/Mcm family)